MFDLEKSIAEWRRQMLSAKIAVAVLDELESHLREEIQRQIQSGASDQEAFRLTVLQMGQPKELKEEFAKGSNDRFKMLDRILGSLWLVLCSLGFFMMSREIIWHLAHGMHGLGLLTGLLLWAIYGIGILGSILVIRRTMLGRWIVCVTAGLFALLSLFILFRVIPSIQPIPIVKVSAFAALYAIIAVLVFLPSYSNMKPPRN